MATRVRLPLRFICHWWHVEKLWPKLHQCLSESLTFQLGMSKHSKKGVHNMKGAPVIYPNADMSSIYI